MGFAFERPPRTFTKQHWLNKLFPVPENLYDKPHGLDLIASPGVTAAYAVALYLLTAAAFAGFAAFYSHPSQHVTEVFVQRDYARAGFACEPSNEQSHSRLMSTSLSTRAMRSRIKGTQ